MNRFTFCISTGRVFHSWILYRKGFVVFSCEFRLQFHLISTSQDHVYDMVKCDHCHGRTSLHYVVQISLCVNTIGVSSGDGQGVGNVYMYMYIYLYYVMYKLVFFGYCMYTNSNSAAAASFSFTCN